jgi:hypothetical protein
VNHDIIRELNKNYPILSIHYPIRMQFSATTTILTIGSTSLPAQRVRYKQSLTPTPFIFSLINYCFQMEVIHAATH